MFGERKRDNQWYDQLWNTHNQLIFNYSAKILRANATLFGDYRAEAADITQQTFHTAWEKRQEVQTGDAATWLRHTARNHIRNLTRKPAQHRESSAESELLDCLTDTGVNAMNAVAERVSLRKPLMRLSTEDRELLVHTYWLDLSTMQIAHLYGITDAAVRTRQSRARGRLRVILEENDMTHLMPPLAVANGDNDA